MCLIEEILLMLQSRIIGVIINNVNQQSTKLYHGGQSYWWREFQLHQKTTYLWTDLYQIMLYLVHMSALVSYRYNVTKYFFNNLLSSRKHDFP